MGTLLRYPYEVRSEEEYFDEIQDVKVTKDMVDLAKHIVNQRAGRFGSLPATLVLVHRIILSDYSDGLRVGVGTGTSPAQRFQREGDVPFRPLRYPVPMFRNIRPEHMFRLRYRGFLHFGTDRNGGLSGWNVPQDCGSTGTHSVPIGTQSSDCLDEAGLRLV
jgi:hypothetical protein